MTERPFKVVSHKPGLTALLARFGAETDTGISVDNDTAATTLWWMTQDWAAQVLQAGIDLPQLTAPPPGFIAGLADKWRNRPVGTLVKRDIPKFFSQHPDYARQHPKVVVSTPGEHSELLPPNVCLAEDLSEGYIEGFGHLPGDMLLQMDAMLPCVVESRYWIATGEVTAHAPYRIGMVGWESNLFQEMLFNANAVKLDGAALAFARQMVTEIDGPPGYALDIGMTLTGVTTVLRAWPAWSADPLHADITGVYRAIAASHDFGGTHTRWRWTPDLRAYDRNRSTDEENNTHE